MDNTLTQGAVVLYMIYGGVCMGVLYDLLRLFRFGRWTNLLCDTIFWIGCFIIASFALMQAVALAFRFYTLLGLILGYVLYYYSIGRMVRKFLYWVACGLQNVFDFMAEILN